MTLKIAHLTSAHPRKDLRILGKQCLSLAQAGHDVSLFVGDGQGNAEHCAVNIIDVGASSNRLDRILNVSQRICQSAAREKFDICHLHDPELLLHLAPLQKTGTKIIYDAHEDLPRQIFSKPYIPNYLKGFTSYATENFLQNRLAHVHGVVAATDHINQLLSKYAPHIATVRNYPLPIVDDRDSGMSRSELSAVYIGGISELRGAQEMVDALALTENDIWLDLVGNFSPPALIDELKRSPGWSKVRLHDYVPHDQVTEFIQGALCGLVVLHPTDAYRHALPVKMFEYMAGSIPVVASDFQLWRNIVSEADCGICVPAKNKKELASALDYLASNRKVAINMGRNGRRAVFERYNWETQFGSLKRLYETIIGPP